jgi:hypothetical protein
MLKPSDWRSVFAWFSQAIRYGGFSIPRTDLAAQDVAR